MVQLSHPYMTTGKTIVLITWTFVSKVMSLLFNTLSRCVITFLPRSKHLLISWLQSPSAMILEPKKIKSVPVSIVSPSICHDDGTGCHDLCFLNVEFNLRQLKGFPGDSVVKNLPANAGDMGSIPDLERTPMLQSN